MQSENEQETDVVFMGSYKAPVQMDVEEGEILSDHEDSSVLKQGYKLKWKSATSQNEPKQVTSIGLFEFEGFLLLHNYQILEIEEMIYSTDAADCKVSFEIMDVPRHLHPDGREEVIAEFHRLLFHDILSLESLELPLFTSVPKRYAMKKDYFYIIPLFKRSDGQYLDLVAVVEYLKQHRSLPIDLSDPLLLNGCILMPKDGRYCFRADRVVYHNELVYIRFSHPGGILNPFLESRRYIKKRDKWSREGDLLRGHLPSREEKVDMRPDEFTFTGLKADVTEFACGIPIVLDHVDHFRKLEILEKRLGVQFIRRCLLQRSLMHASYYEVPRQWTSRKLSDARARVGLRFAPRGKYIPEKHKEEEKDVSYERLEFLGDAVLGFLVSTSLYLTTDYSEGDLTISASALVNNHHISEIGYCYGVDQFIRMSIDSSRADPEFKRSIISDVMEATIGALYLDQGLEACRGLIGRFLEKSNPELKQLMWHTKEELEVLAKEYVNRRDPNQGFLTEQYQEKHADFLSKIDFPVDNLCLWLQALTHKSFHPVNGAEETKKYVTLDPQYERIEYLGDAVLRLSMTTHLFSKFPTASEYRLTELRSTLVSNRRLGGIMTELGIQQYIRMHRVVNATPDLYPVAADIFEALLGAVYLEKVPNNTSDGSRFLVILTLKQGLEAAQHVLEKYLYSFVDYAEENRDWLQPKARLRYFLINWTITGRKASRYIVVEKVKRKQGSNSLLHTIGIKIEGQLMARATHARILGAANAACAKVCKMLGVGIPDPDN